MKNFWNKNKKKVLAIILIILSGILFFSYNITTTWDSSEYLGLADYIGTNEMKTNWIKHRGIAFPLLLKLLKPFGIENKFFILIGMYIFYLWMIFTIYKMYEKLKELGVFKNRILKFVFVIYTLVFTILNPMIFGYYHTVLTEFVAITISLFTCYLSWLWIENSWAENKKYTCIYTIIFSILTIFLYHIKQSLVPLTLIPIIISAFISIVNKPNKTNILSKVITFLIVLITLVLSVNIWNFSMRDADVAESTNDIRVKDRLIYGITTLKKICDESNIQEKDIDRSKLDSKDNEEIDKILSDESNYKHFRIYKTTMNSKYLVYFTKQEGSFKDQLKFHFKVLINSPMDIVKSYYDGYYKIIFIDKNYPIEYVYENTIIPTKIYIKDENVVDVNEEYQKYIENYKTINQMNFVASIFNKYVKHVINMVTIITKFSLWLTPVMGVIAFIIYLIFNKKISENKLKTLQLVIILYITSFGGIMAYIVFGTTVDRYVVPMIIQAFIAHFLFMVLGIYCVKNICDKIRDKNASN